jgi:hypothetical protein
MNRKVVDIIGILIPIVLLAFLTWFTFFSNVPYSKSTDTPVINQHKADSLLAIPYFKRVELRLDTYDVDVIVIITGDRALALNHIRGMYQDTTLTINDFEAKAVTFFNGADAPCIWLPGIPKTPEELGTLNHELFHVTSIIMSHVGIRLTNASDEAYAYVLGSLSREFHNKIKTNE